MSGTWSNDSYTIGWHDEDKVFIRDERYGRTCLMDGGDFEYTLQALIASFMAGETAGLTKARKILTEGA